MIQILYQKSFYLDPDNYPEYKAEESNPTILEAGK